MLRVIVILGVVVGVGSALCRNGSVKAMCTCLERGGDKADGVEKEIVGLEIEATQCDVACSLSPATQQDRLATFNTRLRPKIREMRELDDGYAVRFDADGATIKELAEWIAVESTCCAFLDYELAVQRGGGPIWFRMRGAAEAKSFLKAFLEPEPATAAGG